MGGVVARMLRKKPLELVTPETSLSRCLTAFDLTVMGIGSMVGSGIYVMTGQAIRETAGPAIVISFLLSAVVILMVAGCFTEFAARLQKTGSTYLYVYVILGELPAFLVGFSTLCLCVMSGATNARAWSAYLDSLFSGAISNYTMSTLGTWDVGRPLGRYPDFPAMAALLVVTVVTLLGAKCSSWFNIIFALINVAILTLVSILGFVYGHLENWTDPSHGGFFPFGFSGIASGAAVCFWAYSGFEILSCAVEESVNPRRDIPLATVVVLLTVMVLYVGSTMSLTLISPFYKIDMAAPFPSVFAEQGVYWAQLVVSIGPLCGLTTTLMSSLYSAVRIAYKISEDGLIFQWMSRVFTFSQVPAISVVVIGVLMATVALFLDISELISFSVIFILIFYILVCACVVIMRYSPDTPQPTATTDTRHSSENTTHINAGVTVDSDISDETILYDKHPTSASNGSSHSQNGSLTSSHISPELELPTVDITTGPRSTPGVPDTDVPGAGRLKEACACLWPCRVLGPGRWPQLALLLVCLAMLGLAVVCVHFGGAVTGGTWWAVLTVVACGVTIVAMVASMYAHQQNVTGLAVKMPVVPLLPVLCMCLCIYMIVSLAEPFQWVGVLVLESLGLIVYFAYSMSHSQLNEPTPYGALTTHTEDTTALLGAQSDEDDDAL